MQSSTSTRAYVSKCGVLDLVRKDVFFSRKGIIGDIVSSN